jgi:hypothetical protein
MLPYAITLKSDAALVTIRSRVCQRRAFFVPRLTNGDLFALVAFQRVLIGLIWAFDVIYGPSFFFDAIMPVKMGWVASKRWPVKIWGLTGTQVTQYHHA